MPNPDRDDRHIRFLQLFTEQEGTLRVFLRALLSSREAAVEASFAFRSEFPKQESLYAIKICAFDSSLETSGDVGGNLMEIAIADANRDFRVKRTGIGGKRED